MKKLSFILSLLMVAAAFSACGSAETTSKDTSGESDKPKESVTLTMMVQSNKAFPLNNDWVIWDAHEENTGIKLDVSAYQGDWWDAIPKIIASKDLPDIMWITTDDSRKYGEDGAFINYLEYEESMPNFQKWKEEYPREVTPILSVDGALYMTPSHGAYGQYEDMMLYRKDIFDKHGIALPKTFDELYDVMVKLKELYPESSPLYFADLHGFNTFGASFGTKCDLFHDVEANQVKYGPMEDNFKDLVEFVAKAYQEGLIPLEFGNSDTQKRDKMLSTDTTFMFYGYINQIDRYNTELREANPEFTIDMMPTPAGTGGKQVVASEIFLGEGLAVTTTSKHQDEAIRYVDYLYSEEGREAMSWGKEGVTFEIVDGKHQFMPDVQNITNATVQYGIRSSGNAVWFEEEALTSLMSEETRQAYETGLEYLAPMSVLPALSSDEKDSITLKQQAIGTCMEENITKFVLGQQPLSEWDNYVDQLKKLGIEDVLKVYNDALARQNG